MKIRILSMLGLTGTFLALLVISPAMAQHRSPGMMHRPSDEITITAIGTTLPSTKLASLRQSDSDFPATETHSSGYVAIFSDENTLYSLTLENGNPNQLGQRIAVPQFILEKSSRDVYLESELPNDISVTDPYDFFHGLLSPDGQKMVYVEAQCTDTVCSSSYRVWLVDLHSHERKLLIDDRGFAEGLFMNPVEWSEQTNLIVFDTFLPAQDMRYSGLWTLDLNTNMLNQLDLGFGDYNSSPQLSPDGRYLLFTGSTETGVLSKPGPIYSKPTNLLKSYDLLTQQVTILLENPVGREFFLDGWVLESNLGYLRRESNTNALTQPASSVPPATSGFQYPMTNDHYGFRWLQCTSSGGCPPNVFHPGVDFNGPGSGNADCGTAIYAVANGLVRWVNLGGWGTLVIEHEWQGITVYSQYGHLASALVSPNVVVNKGQQIATMGNTGTETCHLHWEIRESDHPDPSNGSYYASDVLNNSDNVNNYYEDPEWWADNHGAYTPGPQVKLYAQANFGGGVVWNGGVGFSNDPNANSYSMEVPSGWSVKTWRQDNRGGEERCWSSSVNNLQDHGWQNGMFQRL